MGMLKISAGKKVQTVPERERDGRFWSVHIRKDGSTQKGVNRQISEMAIKMAYYLSPEKIDFWTSEKGDSDPSERVRLSDYNLFTPKEGWQKKAWHDVAFWEFLGELGMELGFSIP
jgi:hypothetical protein